MAIALALSGSPRLWDHGTLRQQFHAMVAVVADILMRRAPRPGAIAAEGFSTESSWKGIE